MYRSIKKHLALIGASTVLSGFSLGSILYFSDPFTGNAATIGFFYISLFLVGLGLFTLIGLLLRNMLFGGLYATNFGHSLRQALFVSLLIVCSLMLQANGLLYWWVEATLILFFIATEILFNLKT